LGSAQLIIGAADADLFNRSVAVLGALLLLDALLAGLAKRSFLSLSAVFVLLSFSLGQGGLSVLSFEPDSGFVGALAIVALILILIRDGLEVEAEMLQREWRLPCARFCWPCH
jgi:hypothetical protein